MNEKQESSSTPKSRPIKEYLTVAECAERLSVSPRTIKRWINAGEITPTYRPGGRLLRIPESALTRFVKRYRNDFVWPRTGSDD